MRLDKFLCDNNIGTRSQVKEYIKKGQVTVNDQIIKKPETKANEETDTVVCQGQPIHYRKYVYYMLNKPEGVVLSLITHLRAHETDSYLVCRLLLEKKK